MQNAACVGSCFGGLVRSHAEYSADISIQIINNKTEHI